MAIQFDDDQEQIDQEEGEQEAVDPIALLGEELKQLREALGIGSDAGSASLLRRLDAIEARLAPQDELPSKSITRADAMNPSAMRRLGGDPLKAIINGKIRVEG